MSIVDEIEEETPGGSSTNNDAASGGEESAEAGPAFLMTSSSLPDEASSEQPCQSGTSDCEPSRAAADFQPNENRRFGGGRMNLCVLHQSMRCNGRGRKNTNNVACQTDEDEEFGPVSLELKSNDGASCSDGVLRLMIQNFRNMSDTVRGPSKRIQGVCWRIMVMPRQHVVQKKGTQKCLGFFLQCCPEAFSDAWSCQASAELRLISQKPGIPHFTRKTNHVYTSKENDWGYSCFMTWSDILNESQGYIKEDRVVLEVTVKADPPKNILTLEEFRKSIQNWFDLADMQFHRGCIDLAIEANAQALKFCKDKDDDCRNRLEAQKNFFIEMKLVESINRIEKAGEDASQNNQNAVKMAITSNGKNNKKGNKKMNKEKRVRAPTPTTQNMKNARVNNEVKTEKAAVVRNNQKQKEKTAETPDEANKEDKCKKEERKDDKNGEYINTPVVGSFNSRLLGDEGVLQWIKRSRQEDELFNRVAQMQEEVLSPAERDAFVMRYMTEQMKHLEVNEKGDHDLDTIHELKSFAESAFEVELQRQNIMRNATCKAREFIKQIENNGAVERGSYEQLELDFAKLWDGNNQCDRMGIIDREARYLDAKIRLFWEALGGMDKFNDEDGVWLESDSSSDHESETSAESGDRQHDGCIKAKRTKIDHTCDNCAKYPYMCDSEAQTEYPLDPAPEKKKVENVTLEETPKVNAAPVSNKKKGKNGKKEDEKENIVTPPGIKSPVTAMGKNPALKTKNAVPVLSATSTPAPTSEPVATETAKAPTPAPVSASGSSTEEEVPSGSSSATTSAPESSPVELNFEPGQVMAALKVNVGYARRLISKVEDMVNVVARNCADDNVRNALRDISKIAGTAYVENEEKYRPPTPYAHDASNDLKSNVFYSKLLSSESKDLLGLLQLADRVDVLKNQISKYFYLESDDCERMVKGTAAIEKKLADLNKKLKELQKHHDDAENKYKKIERNLKEENKNVKQQMNGEKDRNAALSKELKEKTRLYKNNEARVNALMAEKEELAEKQKATHRELQSLQKKYTDETHRAKREIHQLSEARRNLQAEINSRDNELKSHAAQLDERTLSLKKLKEELNSEKNKVNQIQQHSLANIDRAKKAEITLLQQQFEIGIARLERATEDANKNLKEMEEAILNSRNRPSTDFSIISQSRDEWIEILQKLKVLIETTTSDYNGHIEAIRNGKSLASLPKISVPKPPPPPQIVKVAPIAPIEPTKPLPGVIGTRPQSTTNNGSRAISPGNRAPGSPISPPKQQQPQQQPLQQPPAQQGNSIPSPVPQLLGSAPSPSRHGPIGSSRPSQLAANGNLDASNSSQNKTLAQFPWSDPISAITEPFHPSKRFGASSTTNDFTNPSSELQLPNLSTSLFGNGWSEDTWGPSLTSLTNGVTSGFGSSLSSTLNLGSNIAGNQPCSAQNTTLSSTLTSSALGAGPSMNANANTVLANPGMGPATHNSGMGPGIGSGMGSSGLNTGPGSSAFGSNFGSGISHGGSSGMNSSGVNAANLGGMNNSNYMNSLMSSNNYSQSNNTWNMQQQQDIRNYYRAQHHHTPQQQYHHNLMTIAKKMGMEPEKCSELITEFCREHKLNSYAINAEDPVVDKLREYYHKKMVTMRMSAPPGAAPGYAMNPLLNSFMADRQMTPNFGPLVDHMDRPSAEKWSTNI